MTPKPEVGEASEIRSRRLSFPGTDGKLIVGYLDEGRNEFWNGRTIVLAPRYGETKKNNLKLAYTLAANGFKVLRYDQTDHIGESDGEMTQFTLSGATQNILSAVDFAAEQDPKAEIILITLSLSCRCGIRACAIDDRITRFVSVVGMVDMNATLKAIYRRDYFSELAEGAEWRLVDILGFEIDGRHFHDDMVTAKLKTVDETIADASKIKIPVLHFYASEDKWVLRSDVDSVMHACKQGQVIELAEVGHEINENKNALREVTEKIIGFCQLGLSKNPVPRLPAKENIISQNRIERELMQKAVRFSDKESDFWNDYLGKFGIIEDAHYYVEYFKKVSDALGTLSSRDTLLDAGCGNGFYGSNVLRQLLVDSGHKGIQQKPIFYLGIDLTPDGLNRSYSRHSEELIQLHQDYLHERGGISFAYTKLDFDAFVEGEKGFPVSDGSIDKLCCSLVVSYLIDPLSFIKEIHRVLKSNGVAVVSSMKPGCDMTVLYHDYLSVDTPTDTENREASKLLSAAGKIKVKKDTEVYNFFSQKELERLAFDAGFTKIDSFRSLGNQANAVRLVK